jgi:hypothetical protein
LKKVEEGNGNVDDNEDKTRAPQQFEIGSTE